MIFTTTAWLAMVQAHEYAYRLTFQPGVSTVTTTLVMSDGATYRLAKDRQGRITIHQDRGGK